jgi:hypothetical protein
MRLSERGRSVGGIDRVGSGGLRGGSLRDRVLRHKSETQKVSKIVGMVKIDAKWEGVWVVCAREREGGNEGRGNKK